jgi:hypothetical protein
MDRAESAFPVKTEPISGHFSYVRLKALRNFFGEVIGVSE